MGKRTRKKALPLIEGEGKRKTGPIMGVDVHKDVLALCIVSETKTMLERNVQNNKAGVQKVVGICKEYQVRSVAMEATSQYHISLLMTLIDAGIPSLLANAGQTVETQGKKTDKLDARRIAIAHRDGRLRPSVISPEKITHLRKNNRTIARLIQDMTRCKQRLNQVFHQHDCNVKHYVKGFLTTTWTMELLHAALTASDKMISINDLIEQCYPRNPAKRTNDDLERIEGLAEELGKLLAHLGPLEKQVVSTNVMQLRLCSSLLEQHRLTNCAVVKHDPPISRQLRVLLSIPGIGPDTAFCVLAEVVDINLFASPEKLVKWAGLAPRVHQSGHRKHITGRIHKGGNKHLRRALTLACAHIYARGDTSHPIYAFIKTKYDQTGKYWLAVCAGARKLLTILWYLLRRDEEWRPPSITDVVVLSSLQRKIARKIQAAERLITRYESLQVALTEKLADYLEPLPQRSCSSNDLLRSLLRAT